jgi:hypothetical protein
MQTTNKHPHHARPTRTSEDECSPPVTRWNLPAPRLQGVRFEGPVTKLVTVNTPIRPKRTA